MIEDKPVQGEGRSYSFWDVQDQNAKLPVKQTSQSDLRKLLFPSKSSSSSSADVTKAAKGAFKMMGKMAEMAVGSDAADSHGPPVSVLVFKLLDMVKINDDYNLKQMAHGGGVGVGAGVATPKPRAPRPAAPRPQQPRQQQQQQQQAPPQQRRAQPPPQQRPPQRQQEASLMDFGDAPAAPAPAHHHTLHHATSSPPSFNETRAEKLKREYEQKKQQANRVWDDVDQRWVEVDPKQGNSARGSGGANGMPKKKEVGISLDPANAVGKSASVQAAVNKRVNDMKESQEKALKEVREREQKKKMEEDQEDEVRKQLEPKIKAWAEEHGQKKQLRALLASLHTILWPGAKWKQISIGDVLPDAKCKKFFHKATLVVHPDKTHHLPPDQRFLAKRIFDALCQAKTEFDNGAK